MVLVIAAPTDKDIILPASLSLDSDCTVTWLLWANNSLSLPLCRGFHYSFSSCLSPFSSACCSSVLQFIV